MATATSNVFYKNPFMDLYHYKFYTLYEECTNFYTCRNRLCTYIVCVYKSTTASNVIYKNLFYQIYTFKKSTHTAKLHKLHKPCTFSTQTTYKLWLQEICSTKICFIRFMHLKSLHTLNNYTRCICSVPLLHTKHSLCTTSSNVSTQGCQK